MRKPRNVFPVFLMWETGFWEIIKDVIDDVFGRQAKAAVAAVFGIKSRTRSKTSGMSLENLASKPGTIQWDEMKENAEAASGNRSGGLALLFRELQKSEYAAMRKRLRLHLIGHSAGSIVHAYLTPALVQGGFTIDGIHFLAPACRAELFATNLLPFFEKDKIAYYTQFHLTDIVERRDNCGTVYRQSLLYLVSNSFEHKRGTPILEMEKFSDAFARPRPAGAKVWDWIAAPTSPVDTTFRTNSTSHGGFDDDPDTRAAVLARIGRRQGPPPPPAGSKHPAELRSSGFAGVMKLSKKSATRKSTSKVKKSVR